MENPKLIVCAGTFRCYLVTTHSMQKLPVAENLLEQQFKVRAEQGVAKRLGFLSPAAYSRKFYAGYLAV